jgi:hypothetical protein
MYSGGGPEFFKKATNFEKGIWETEEGKLCLDIVAKLASYTNPKTPSQANDQDFTKNQLMVMKNEALFMPNGTWVVGEMADAPRADGFRWGFSALPAIDGERYSFTFFEQGWIPSEADNKKEAKSSDGDGGGDDSFDPMFRPALELAVNSGKISTSLIQRKLELGYGRAAKLIDRMESMGYVSAANGAKPREVLITRQQYQEMVLRDDDSVS